MTLFDVLAGLLLLISALNGLTKGGTRILGGMLAFLASAFLAIAMLRISAPIARGMISPDWAAVTAALVVVFVTFFVVFRLIAGHLATRVQAGPVGALDRAIGVGFGFIRALVILGAFTLLIQMAAAPNRPPAWVADSVLYPLTEGAGRVLKAFAPGVFSTVGKIGPAVGDAVKDGAGYSDQDRQSMDDLVEKSR